MIRVRNDKSRKGEGGAEETRNRIDKRLCEEELINDRVKRN